MISPIQIIIRVRDEASGVLGVLQGKLTALGAATAAYFGINAFMGAIKGAGDFEAALSRVQAATGGSKEELAQLRKAAEESGVNSTLAAGALEELTKAGLSAKDAIGTLPAVINLAKAGSIDFGKASEFLTAAVMGMGLKFSDAGRVADVLTKGANETKTSVNGLALALSYTAPVAQSMGLSLESTVAICAQFAQAGIDASRSGTALNNILSQFSDPASKFRRELSAAGITTGDFETALHQLAKAGPIGAAAINSVGLRAGPALRAMLNLGMPALDELTAKLKNAEGAAAAAAKIMETNLNGSLLGLENAWKYVKDTLATPVLPVITSAVNDLITALRGAVQDGTIGKFGDAIAVGFQTGIAWIKDFKAQINFTQVAADLRAFADRTGEVFTQISEYASTAGSSAKLAYGVMSAGANAVLALVYGLGSAFAEMASKFSQSAAVLYEGLAKITPGKLGDEFRQAAEDARNAAKGFGDAAQAMRDKAVGSMGNVADSAKLARDGFAGLADSATSAKPAITAISSVVDDLGSSLEATRQKSHDAEKATNDKKTADEAATVALRQLRAEYAALIDKGDLQGAADKIKEINKALQGTQPAAADAAKAAADAAKKIADAFAGLGITSQATLKMAAESARIYYDQIKGDANSTAVDISNAFKAAADKAIAANNGIAPSWVTAQAAARSLEVQVDSTGKSILVAMGKGSDAAKGLGDAVKLTTEQIKAQEDAADRLAMKYTLSADYTERQIALLERENALVERRNALERERLNIDKEGYSLNTAGQRVNAQVESPASIYQRAKSAGLTDAQALQLSNETALPYNGPSVKVASPLDDGSNWSTNLQKKIDQLVLNNASAAPATAPAPAGQTPSVSTTHIVRIEAPNGKTTSLNTASEADSQILVTLLRDLAAAKSVSIS